MPISRPQIMKDGILICLVSAATMSLAGYLHDVMLGAMSMFYLMILVNGFFGPGTYAIIGPYMTEVWPAPLRASGLGLAYGTSNLGKFIGPAGLALIAGASKFVPRRRRSTRSFRPSTNLPAGASSPRSAFGLSGSRRAAARSKSSTRRSPDGRPSRRR